MSGVPSIALVTGANRGIGFEVARSLLTRGLDVVLGVRSVDEGEKALAMLGAEGRASLLELDVSDDASVTAAARAFEQRFARLDILVNNAGISYDSAARGVDVDLAAVHVAMETNLFGPWRVIQRFLPLLRRSEHPRIVNVSSEGGSLASMGAVTPASSTSKAALNALTRIIAAETRADRMIVNAVCPGWTATEMGGSGGRPVSRSAASVVWGALLDDDGFTGGFFRDGKPLPW